MKLKLQARDPLWLALATSVWMASAGNIALWHAWSRLPEMSGVRGVAIAVGLSALLAALLMLAQALLAGARSSKWVATVLLAITAPSAYFMLTYGVVIDASMMNNILQTHPGEVRELLSLRLVLFVVVLAALPIAALWCLNWTDLPWSGRLRRNLGAAGLSALIGVLLSYVLLADVGVLMRNHKQLRYLMAPHNVIYAGARLIAGPTKNLALVADDTSPHLAHGAGPGLPVLVLVVGETARADRFGINGYARDTTPNMQARGVLSFTNVSSCGTNTADSLPCMFSHLGRERFFSTPEPHENLLDVLARVGYEVLWLDNNSGCKGVCARVPSEDLSKATDAQLCGADGCFDGILSKNLGERVQTIARAKPKAKGIVLVLHQLGSHGPAYYKRSPEAAKRFAPECKTNVLQDCSAEMVGNAYDNSIAYTDSVLSEVLAQLEALPARFAPGMVYISDHGESLGEGGVYLHGLPYPIAPKAQTHVPMLLWLSPGMLKWRSLNAACLRQQTGVKLSHDNLYHTVLELLDADSSTYIEDLDLLEPCESPQAHIKPRR